MTPDVEFVKRLVVLAEVMGEPLSEMRIGGYWAALSDLDLEDLCAAMDRALKTSRFFPRPAEIRATVEDIASKRWERRQALQGPPDRLRLLPGDTLATDGQWQTFLTDMRKLIKTMPEPERLPHGRVKR